ncbi:hypothetical protein MGN70_010538 [Eutypa lata]|nr:hypothetical protein MGN70_010538 [Eutypa lata]
MSSVHQAAKEFEAANEKYAASFNKGDLPLPPGRYAASDPAKVLGLEEGDAHVIRNAGGRTIEALRSLVISQQLLGTREIVIIHHTDCGMLTFTDEALRNQIKEGELKSNADHIAFLPFNDVKQSVLDDIAVLRASPLLLDVPVTGYIYEVETGKIVKV